MNDDAESRPLPTPTATMASSRDLDARRKRIRMLHELLRDLDTAVYMQLLAVYHADCSFFWLAARAGVHGVLLTPSPDSLTVDRPPDEPRPFLSLLLGSFLVCLGRHLWHPIPPAGEDTRGYLHGGLLIDFIGRPAPTTKWTLAVLDLCLLCLQLVMVAVYVTRRELKKQLSTATASPAAPPVAAHDTADEDALDLLSSGQSVLADFTLVDTLLHEHAHYTAYRSTRADTAPSHMPETLRRLNTLRARFGAGGG